MRKKPLEERMTEFVQYHKNGDGECNTVVLCRWADGHNLSFQERYELAFYFSVTYCVISAIVMFRDRGRLLADVDAWSKEHKKDLVFQSDRKYVRMKDSFQKAIKFWKANAYDGKKFVRGVSEEGVLLIEKAVNAVERWEMFGRFSAFLFLEMFVNLTGLKVQNTTIVWKDGNTATSGLLNLFGYDEAADAFDRKGKLHLPADKMDNMLSYTISRVQKAGASTNVTELETSLCAYRKFYKGSRYNGYYLDRMLEEIKKLEPKYPDVAKEVLEIRAEAFNRKYLGEYSGWTKIRPDMKKLYRETGIVT